MKTVLKLSTVYFFSYSFPSNRFRVFFCFCRFQELKEQHDDRTETMLRIYEDGPARRDADSQQRCSTEKC